MKQKSLRTPATAPPNEISGSKSSDILKGTPGDDLILGRAGDDFLSGFGGKDILNGGTGADAMTGGLGNDIYLVDDVGDTVAEDPDGGTDTIRSWIDFSLAGQSENVEILALFGTADLNGTGSDRNNRLTGNSGANLLIGLGGNDKINGGLGADDMRGGAGNDVYLVDDVGDTITEAADEGTDTVRSSVSFSMADQSAHLENLMLLGKGDIDGTGNARDNVLKGNSGANILIGGGGKDKLDGKAGGDDLRGGKGDDIYVVDDILDRVAEEAGGGYDVVRSTVRFSLQEHSQHLEALTLLGRDDVGALGNDKNNVIRGNNGKNFLFGFGGNDRIFGNGGNDRLVETEGDDFFNGGGGTDIVQFDSAISNFDIDMVRGKTGAFIWRVKDINPDDGDTGTDRFVNVELLNFKGVVVDIGEKPYGYNHVPILGDDTLATDEDSILRFRNTLWDNDLDPDDFLPRNGDVILPTEVARFV